ncbi:GGDEF domain-containing protein [Cellvibrio mixtus]|uniref:GGDEF domain-containing protein n=1 Tax=Cellvibrio mixtus TaxID=39650 RepID=UPI000586B398|nr:GGDEF domain-containing protein [Cellvibrio mixtus]
MSGDKNNWRDKYLNALDEQEQLEQKFTRQQELLRSALVRVSIAADGQDETLDNIMSQLREKLRSETSAMEMNKILEQLEKAALAFESHREQGAKEITVALSETIKALGVFKLSKGVTKEISDFLANLPQRSKKIRLYPALLQQLANIQQQALKEVEQPKVGLLGKILGTKPAKADEQGAAESDTDDYIDTLPLPAGVNTDPAPKAATISTTEQKPAYLDAIVRILNEILQSLENDVLMQSRAVMLRNKLAAGIAPDAVIPALESVRALVMEAYLAASQAFASYLKNVNEELADIYSLLGGAVKHSQNERAASRKLQDDMIREMGELESSAEKATDLNQLKDKVKSQLGNIRQALDQHQNMDHAQQHLALQLETLGAKIKTMEVEAEKNRTSLEVQRKKALQDALTELPNREAYNERAHVEVQRWQRYGRPLSVAIFDIDHFKRINDTFGHQAGDRVIKVIGRSIAKRLREVDFFCRYGGEEFVALMPETDSQAALGVLEKVRDAIANAAFNYKDQPLTITVSIGVTEFKTSDSLETAFERADQALYTAKSGGRNRCQRL